MIGGTEGLYKDKNKRQQKEKLTHYKLCPIGLCRAHYKQK